MKGKIIYFAVSITILIGVLSLIQVPETPIKISNQDKIYHAIAYFTLAIFWLLSFLNSIEKKKIKYIIVLCCIFYGIVLEVLQPTLTTYRTASFLDVVANTVGVIVALLIFTAVYKKNKAI